MSDLVPYGSDSFKTMDEIAQLTMKGKSDFAIARTLGIKRVEVMNYQAQWRDLLKQDRESHEAAKDQLNQMVKHYDLLIDKSYELLTELEELSMSHQVAAQRNATLSNIANYEKIRVDLMQKAGILEGSDLGDELADMEHKQSILIDILRNDLCEVCQNTVARRLREVTGQTEAIKVENVNE